MKLYVYTSPGCASDSDWWHGLQPSESPGVEADQLFDFVLKHAEGVYLGRGEQVHDDPPQWYALPNLAGDEPLWMRVHFHKGSATVISPIDLNPEHPCRLVIIVNRDFPYPIQIYHAHA